MALMPPPAATRAAQIHHVHHRDRVEAVLAHFVQPPAAEARVAARPQRRLGPADLARVGVDAEHVQLRVAQGGLVGEQAVTAAHVQQPASLGQAFEQRLERAGPRAQQRVQADRQRRRAIERQRLQRRSSRRSRHISCRIFTITAGEESVEAPRERGK